MKKGFTLIELLAVVLILGIISVIAIPTIATIVEDSKKGAAELSAKNYMDALNDRLVFEKLKDRDILENGIYSLQEISERFTNIIKGDDLKEGYVTITNGKISQIVMCTKGYLVASQGEKMIVNDECVKVEISVDCFEYNENDNEIEITDYLCGKENTKYISDLIIPYEINGKPVKKIGNRAFSDKGLTSLIILEGVENIGNQAFRNNNITNIVIPDSVTSIGSYAFGNNKIESVVIPKNVTYISSAIFTGNTTLTSLVVDPSNPKYDSRDNCNCIIETTRNRLIAGGKTTKIPDSVTTIANEGLAYGNDIKEIIIPSSVTSIGGHGLANNKITSIIIPSSVTSIGQYAFQSNPLVSVVFENPTGWTIDGNSVDLTNPSTNATYLKDTYNSKSWTRN